MPEAPTPTGARQAGPKTTEAAAAGPDWPNRVHDALRVLGVRQVAYVPDSGLARLIARCRADDRMLAVRLTSEEEGVAQLGGAWLGGDRGVLLMQSSGVGNCVNMLGFVRECRLPLLMLVTMRGDWGEFNPWQVPMGRSAARVLEAAGVIVSRVEAASDMAETVYAAARLAFDSCRPVAVLVAQRVIGFKDWGE